MKSICRIWACLALVTIVALIARSAVAQSPNPQAVKWFKAGLTEKDAGKKIVAYTQAIELDPLFVEAFYNLGVVYKSQSDYPRAEQFLLKAYNAKPDKTGNDTKLQILSELATTYEKLGKVKECETALRQAKNLVVDPTRLAIISFALGRLLYGQGRYEECLAELQEAQKLNPASQGEFAKLIQSAYARLSKSAEGELSTQESERRELERLYEAAEKAKAGGNLMQAKALFEQIRAKRPDYKNVETKLAELDSLLNADVKKNALAAMYEQAQEQAAEGKVELAIATYETLLQQSPNYKEAGSKLQTVRQQLERNQLHEKLEAEYANGITALKIRDWTRAILAFEKVLESDRNFREARKKLSEAQSGLDRESAETAVARYYAEGVAAMNRNDLGAALAALEKVRRLKPNYRQTASLWAELENALQKKAEFAAVPSIPVAAAANYDSLYEAGLAALARADWMQALITFEKVHLLKPNYREVVDRLAEARTNLRLTEQANAATAPSSGNSPLLYAGLAALVGLPLLGFVMFSPFARARLYLLRGNYSAAALLYEHMLARHPNKIKLCSALANIYLLLGRRDEKALKIFRTVLQLNLATRNRDEISAIVAQNMLAEGRMDSDAIEVLESALQAERRRANG